MKTVSAFLHLIIALLLTAAVGRAQGFGNTVTTPQAGAFSGSCPSVVVLGVDTTHSNIYFCPAGTWVELSNSGGSGANTALSNLSAVAINTTLLPGTAGAENLGTAPLPFGDVFIGGAANNSADFNVSNLTANRTVLIPNFNTLVVPQAYTCGSHTWAAAINSTTGATSCAQPASTDLSDIPIPVSSGGTHLATLTAHNVMLGEGTSNVAFAAPGATVGVPLISQNATTDPIFGTAVVAGGGTGLATLTAHNFLLGEGTGNVAFLSCGAGTTVLGNASDPTCSAALTLGVQGTTAGSLTIAGTSGTNGQLIIGGGTSGSLTVTTQAAASSPTWTAGTSSGTPAVTASSPLGITTATGNATCSTCATTTNGGALTATAPVTISAAGLIAATPNVYWTTPTTSGSTQVAPASKAILAIGFTVVYPITYGHMVVRVGVVDTGAGSSTCPTIAGGGSAGSRNCYDVGIHDSTGALISDIGPVQFSGTGVFALAIAQGGTKTLVPGKYYLSFGGDAATAALGVGQAAGIGFTGTAGTNEGGSLSGGQMVAFTPNADSWAQGIVAQLGLY